ncbi:GDNF family receptor alpha-like [Hypanus sabinus]|uniref:GDNF family receptor alpha-like n=1 Tax=Hypanus sabinus TaxID=79690 RepID=UPI0028C49928|nr:GDNF family receptor alpha-like [Hypanus sabinus]
MNIKREAILTSLLTIAPGLESTKCLQAKKWCISDKGSCKDVWDLIEEVCNQTGDSCTVKDQSNCNIAVQLLTSSYPALRECSCPEDKSCNFFRKLGTNCSSQKEHSRAPSTGPEMPPGWKRRFQMKSIDKHIRKVIDCAAAKDACLQSMDCSSIYSKFKKTCRHKKDNCSSPAIGQQCLTAWQALQHTQLTGCSCSRQGKCLRIQSGISNNACVQIALKSFNASSSEGKEENIPEQNAVSCLKVTEQCIRDQDICNKHFTPQKKACPQVRKQCNMEICHREIRSFYTKISPDLAQMLVFCGCDPSDKLCLQAKETLHNNSCANHMDTMPTCLHLKERCVSEDVCRSRYELFQEKCWGHFTRICNQDYDQSCLSGLNWNEWTCRADAECMAAYIRTRGTLLQVQCTCSGVTRDDQPLCELFQHMLNYQVCFTTEVPSPAIEADTSQLEEFSVRRTPMKLSVIALPVVYGWFQYLEIQEIL